MSREWKPGDVAKVRCSDGEWRTALHYLYMGRWTWAFGDGTFRDADTSDARPLVVIDPEDRDALDDLCKALVEAMRRAGDARSAANGVYPATMKAALRSLIEPPKPKEPTGLGAVVEDAAGNKWIRAARIAHGWHRPMNNWARYSDIEAVRVLSEGVTA